MNQFDAFEQVPVPVPAVAFVILTEQESPPATIRPGEGFATPGMLRMMRPAMTANAIPPWIIAAATNRPAQTLSCAMEEGFEPTSKFFRNIKFVLSRL